MEGGLLPTHGRNRLLVGPEFFLHLRQSHFQGRAVHARVLSGSRILAFGCGRFVSELPAKLVRVRSHSEVTEGLLLVGKQPRGRVALPGKLVEPVPFVCGGLLGLGGRGFDRCVSRRRRGAAWLPRPISLRKPLAYSGFFIVHLLPEFLCRLFVDLLQGLDGAQDRHIASGLEVASQAFQRHSRQRRQIGYTRATTV